MDVQSPFTDHKLARLCSWVCPDMAEGRQGHGTQGERFQKVSAIHDVSLDPVIVMTMLLTGRCALSAFVRQRFEGDDVLEKGSAREGVSTQ